MSLRLRLQHNLSLHSIMLSIIIIPIILLSLLSWSSYLTWWVHLKNEEFQKNERPDVEK